jgi:hypothetical protein
VAHELNSWMTSTVIGSAEAVTGKQGEELPAR